jgi:hypothetical protein
VPLRACDRIRQVVVAANLGVGAVAPSRAGELGCRDDAVQGVRRATGLGHDVLEGAAGADIAYLLHDRPGILVATRESIAIRLDKYPTDTRSRRKTEIRR